MRTEKLLPFKRSDKQLFPISVTWQPPFTMMVDLARETCRCFLCSQHSPTTMFQKNLGL